MNDNGQLTFRRREVWLDLPGEGYEGFRIRVWANPPARIWNQVMASESATSIEEGLKQIVLEHNGWRGFEGQELPQPDTSEFWQEIPTELAGLIISETQIEMQRLPNSRPPKRRK